MSWFQKKHGIHWSNGMALVDRDFKHIEGRFLQIKKGKLISWTCTHLLSKDYKLIPKGSYYMTRKLH